MKKILIALLSLSAASFAFAGGDAAKDKAAKCDANCTKECCKKDAKACTDAKAACKATDTTKDAKPAETAVKK
jgi:hypothetical protein